ncbi:uncharacterized protein [Aegilops tauschii subsp. strangulata]|uniref:uncharacterized protein isoform X2 n=1 Tax=Aegilops tauschii subsp. strangulata TaxID=200361 RepID=UPI003CC897C1
MATKSTGGAAVESFHALQPDDTWSASCLIPSDVSTELSTSLNILVAHEAAILSKDTCHLLFGWSTCYNVFTLGSLSTHQKYSEEAAAASSRQYLSSFVVDGWREGDLSDNSKMELKKQSIVMFFVVCYTRCQRIIARLP